MHDEGQSTRQIGFALATLLVSASFLGCPLLKKKAAPEEDASASASETAPADASLATVSGTGAKNEANVLRYANESPLANEPAVIGAEGAHARNFPGNGPEVAFLPKGTAVAKIAQYFSTGVLVMFDDPAADGTKLIGWVPPKVFDVAAPAPTKPVVVPPRVVDAGVIVTVKDAGASPVAKDAGAAPVVDAGGGGGGIPQPSKGTIAVPPTGGKCPDGWVVENDMCRRKCNADADCPRTTKCVAKKPGKVCTSDH